MAKKTLDIELQTARDAHEILPSQVYVGAMLEIPSLYFSLRKNIHLFDFISVGTNDLKQFFFASDRGNRLLFSRYDNLSVSFLSFLKEIAEISSKAKVPCSVCGEMAGNPLEALVLIGLGFRSFSMNPSNLLKVKIALRNLNCAEFSGYLKRLLLTENTSLRLAVESYLRDHKVLEG